MLELLVIVVDHTNTVGLTVGEVARKVAADSRPEKGRDSPSWWQVVLVDVVQYL